MKIRKADRRDFGEFVELRKQTFREANLKKLKDEEIKIKKEFNDFLKSPKKLFFIIENENEVLGYLIGTFLSNVWKKSIYLDDVFVKKTFRRKGFASKLIKEFIKKGRQKRINEIRLGVDIKNKRAIELYKKLGFKIYHYEMKKKLK